MNVTSSSIQLLADIGFLAVSSSYTKHAFAIFNAIELERPKSPLSHIGYAFQYMNQKLYHDALDILYKKALPLDVNNSVTKAFIALVLIFAGRHKESEVYLHEVLLSDDESAKSMVNLLKEEQSQ